MHTILDFLAGLIALLTVQYFFKAFVTLTFNVLLGPLVQAFWEHAREYANGQHKEHSPLKCEKCSAALMSTPD